MTESSSKISKKKLFLVIPLIGVFLVMAIIAGYWIYHEIIFYSYLSVVSVCDEKKFEDSYSDNFKTGGSLSVSVNENGEENVTVYISDEADTGLSVHELCHLKQYHQHRIFGCDHQILKLTNEIECYSAQRFYEIWT